MESRLYLETAYQYGKTRIKDLYAEAPYKIMSPFYDEKHMEVMQMSASAGLLGGDHFFCELYFGEHSDVTYSSQSYEKVFDTKEKQAVKEVVIKAARGSKVKYMPKPVIPFQNSDFLGKNTIELAEDAVFLYSDIFTCGRTGMGEAFAMKGYRSRTVISVDHVPVFADHTLILPETFRYTSMGMWEKYTHNGMLYLHLAERKQELLLQEEIREMLPMGKDMQAGVTQCSQGIVLRVLGMSGEAIFLLFQKIADRI